MLYPRAGTLGGCTAHNAMILVYPHNAGLGLHRRNLPATPVGKQRTCAVISSGWKTAIIARLHRWLSKLGLNPTRHGWRGWLHTKNDPCPRCAARPCFAGELLSRAALEAFREEVTCRGSASGWALESGFDPNDWRLVSDNAIGTRYLPMTTQVTGGSGSERGCWMWRAAIRTGSDRHERIGLESDLSMSRIGPSASNIWRANDCIGRTRMRATPSGELRSVKASREVILAGGAFNTPQLLMLSGIGPPETLERHGIPVPRRSARGGKKSAGPLRNRRGESHEFPGVGCVQRRRPSERRSAMYRMEPARQPAFTRPTGSVLTLFRRSPGAGKLPDLFCMSLLAPFRGYYPGYSAELAEHLNYLTWVVLKAHTQNRAGEVTLRSNDPRDTPLIDFNYFKEGGEQDLEAVVDGIRFVRRLTAG